MKNWQESDENTEDKGINFFTAFIVILLLHVVGILTIFYFGTFKEKFKELVASLWPAKYEVAENFDKYDQRLWPNSDKKPKIVARAEVPPTAPLSKTKPLPVTKSIAEAKPKPQPKTASNTSNSTADVKPKRPKQQQIVGKPKPPTQQVSSSKPKENLDKKIETYVIATGDNLYMISRKMGTTFQQLLDDNNIKDIGTLKVGQTLVAKRSVDVH